MPVFNLSYPKTIEGVNSEILNPVNTWKNKEEYNATVRKVAGMFHENFKKYDNIASDAVKSGAPQL